MHHMQTMLSLAGAAAIVRTLTEAGKRCRYDIRNYSSRTDTRKMNGSSSDFNDTVVENATLVYSELDCCDGMMTPDIYNATRRDCSKRTQYDGMFSVVQAAPASSHVGLRPFDQWGARKRCRCVVRKQVWWGQVEGPNFVPEKVFL